MSSSLSPTTTTSQDQHRSHDDSEQPSSSSSSSEATVPPPPSPHASSSSSLSSSSSVKKNNNDGGGDGNNNNNNNSSNTTRTATAAPAPPTITSSPSTASSAVILPAGLSSLSSLPVVLTAAAAAAASTTTTAVVEDQQQQQQQSHKAIAVDNNDNITSSSSSSSPAAVEVITTTTKEEEKEDDDDDDDDVVAAAAAIINDTTNSSRGDGTNTARINSNSHHQHQDLTCTTTTTPTATTTAELGRGISLMEEEDDDEAVANNNNADEVVVVVEEGDDSNDDYRDTGNGDINNVHDAAAADGYDVDIHDVAVVRVAGIEEEGGGGGEDIDDDDSDTKDRSSDDGGGGGLEDSNDDPYNECRQWFARVSGRGSDAAESDEVSDEEDHRSDDPNGAFLCWFPPVNTGSHDDDFEIIGPEDEVQRVRSLWVNFILDCTDEFINSFRAIRRIMDHPYMDCDGFIIKVDFGHDVEEYSGRSTAEVEDMYAHVATAFGNLSLSLPTEFQFHVYNLSCYEALANIISSDKGKSNESKIIELQLHIHTDAEPPDSVDSALMTHPQMKYIGVEYYQAAGQAVKFPFISSLSTLSQLGSVTIRASADNVPVLPPIPSSSAEYNIKGFTITEESWADFAKLRDLKLEEENNIHMDPNRYWTSLFKIGMSTTLEWLRMLCCPSDPAFYSLLALGFCENKYYSNSTEGIHLELQPEMTNDHPEGVNHSKGLYNFFTRIGAASSLKNLTLVNYDFNGNDISRGLGTYLLRTHTLQTLTIENSYGCHPTQLTAADWKHVCRGVGGNTSLKRLSVGELTLDNDGFIDGLALLKNHSTLEALSVEFAGECTNSEMLLSSIPILGKFSRIKIFELGKLDSLSIAQGKRMLGLLDKNYSLIRCPFEIGEVGFFGIDYHYRWNWFSLAYGWGNKEEKAEEIRIMKTILIIFELNHHGRRYLIERYTEEEGAIDAYAFTRLLAAVANDLDCLFFHLRESPLLVGGG